MKYSNLIIFGLLIGLLFSTNVFAQELSDQEVLNEVKAKFAQGEINDAQVIVEEGEKILFMEIPKFKSPLYGMDSETIANAYSFFGAALAISAFKIATKGKDFRKVKMRYDLKDKEGFCIIAIAKMSNFKLYSDRKITLKDFCRLMDGKKEKCQ